MNAITITPFEGTEAADAEIAEIHALSVAVAREQLPDDPPFPLEDVVIWFRSPRPHTAVYRWVAREEGVLVGYANFDHSTTDDNTNLGGFEIEVPAHRRREGIGARLLASVLDVAEREGRTLLHSMTSIDSPGASFLDAIGGRCKIVNRRSRVLIDEVDRGLMREWVAKAEERAAEYEMLSWIGRTPDDLVEAFAALIEVMNTAPREDFEMEDERYTPDMLRASEERAERNGLSVYTAVARHKPSGELAGFSQVGITKHAPWQGWQWGTGVWPKHRDRGLGRWVKADVMLRLLERPGLRWVDTWNAQSNDSMLGINVAMGYKPLKSVGEWQVSLDDARSAVDARLERADVG
ncbi:MAG TPA: GNAT family N-acetyltransferase [Acidimicrobiales bacterium]|nr:GNAT family N-acetyltransferase [Acidimicrobiales bacterium]